MMDFLVMPQSNDSLIECYSADGGNCNILICGCNDGMTCECNGYTPCSCNGSHFNCPCYATYSPPCPGLHCPLHCAVHLGTRADDSMPVI